MSPTILDKLSAEDKILVYCGNVVLDDHNVTRLRKLVSRGVKWKYLVRTSMKHGILPLVARHMLESILPSEERRDPKCIPGNILSMLKVSRLLTAVRNRELYAELERIVRAFNDRGVAVVILKGPALAKLIYQRDDLRSFSDLDIFIRCEDRPSAHELMPMLGYVQGNISRLGKIIPTDNRRILYQEKFAHHSSPFVRADQEGRHFEVEVHTTQVPSGLWSPLDLREIIARATPIRINNTRTLTLYPLDLLIFACNHYYLHTLGFFHVASLALAAKHSPPTLRNIYDIVWIIHKTKPTWSELLERIFETQGVIPVYCALSRVKLLYPEMIADEFLKEMRSKSELKHWSKRKLQQLTANQWNFKGYNSYFIHRLINQERELHMIKQTYKKLLKNKLVGAQAVCPKHRMQEPVKENLRKWDISTHSFPDLQIRESRVPKWNYFNTHLTFGFPPDSDDDCSAKCWLAWEKDCFHLLVEVRDDKVEFCESTGEVPFWFQDELHLAFSVDKSKSTIKRLCIECSPTNDSGRAFVRDSSQKTWEPTTKCKIQWTSTPPGYVLKLRIPWSIIGLRPKEGTTIGFDIGIFDIDHKPSGTIERSLAWSGFLSGVSEWGDFPEILGTLIFV